MKRYFALLLVLSLLASLLVGCQTQVIGTTGASTTQPTTESTTKPTQTEPVVVVTPGQVRINELMPNNNKLCLGHAHDWIELYNAEETSICLDGYFLTDDILEPEKYPLQGLQIPADGYLVIVLDEAAAFRLSTNGETISLICNQEVISQFTYGLMEEGGSLDADGLCDYPTPGFANTEEGYLAYLNSLTLPELIINEVMSSNSVHNPQGGKCYDMVELFNRSDAPIDLSQYTLSDKRSEPARYSFPAVTLAPGEYYVVYCSGKPELGSNHASFKLSAQGETVYLSKNSVLTDVLEFTSALQENHSYGRVGNIPMYLDTPTFGKANTDGYLWPMAAPAADHPSGVYEEAFFLSLSAEGDIYYTLDGTTPSSSSTRYTGPISIDKACTVRTFCESQGRNSTQTSYTYVVGAQHQLPVVVVSIPQEALTGDQGVLNHIDQNYEHQAMLTLLENGEEKFSVPFGFRLHGNGSRKCPKQNFQLRFRSEYGLGKLEYPVFEDRDISEFNSLLLKGGSEDWFAANFRDELASDLADGNTALYTLAIKPVVLYLGGQYWGVYYLRERYSDDYVASHLNVDKESVDLLSSTAAAVQSGSNRDFLALRDFCQANDMSLDENYQYLCSQIDVTSLMDWYICRSYMGDADQANIRRFRSSQADGKWRWMYFDLDWSFWHATDSRFTEAMQRRNGEPILMRAVLAHPDGRDQFLRRYAQLMDTVLNEAYVTGVIDSMAAAIESEMPQDRQRWNQSLSGWGNAVQKLRDFVANGRRNQLMKEDLQAYFGLTEAQMEEYFG